MTEDYNRDIINSSAYQSMNEHCVQLKEALDAAVEYNKVLQEKIRELEAGRTDGDTISRKELLSFLTEADLT